MQVMKKDIEEAVRQIFDDKGCPANRQLHSLLCELTDDNFLCTISSAGTEHVLNQIISNRVKTGILETLDSHKSQFIDADFLVTLGNIPAVRMPQNPLRLLERAEKFTNDFGKLLQYTLYGIVRQRVSKLHNIPIMITMQDGSTLENPALQTYLSKVWDAAAPTPPALKQNSELSRELDSKQSVELREKTLNQQASILEPDNVHIVYEGALMTLTDLVERCDSLQQQCLVFELEKENGRMMEQLRGLEIQKAIEEVMPCDEKITQEKSVGPAMTILLEQLAKKDREMEAFKMMVVSRVDMEIAQLQQELTELMQEAEKSSSDSDDDSNDSDNDSNEDHEKLVLAQLALAEKNKEIKALKAEKINHELELAHKTEIQDQQAQRLAMLENEAATVIDVSTEVGEKNMEIAELQQKLEAEERTTFLLTLMMMQDTQDLEVSDIDSNDEGVRIVLE